MKDGLTKRLEQKNGITPVLVLETMHSLLLEKQAAPSLQRSNAAIISSFNHRYSTVAASLQKTIELAKTIEQMDSAIKKETELLNAAASQSKSDSSAALKVIREDHNKEIEQLKADQRSLEIRNGELTKQIANPPEKRIEALQAKIAECDRKEQSMSDLIPKIDNNETYLTSIMKQINNNILEREAFKRQLHEIREGILTDPKAEQKKVREQMIAVKNQITELSKASNQSLIATRKDRCHESKANMIKAKELIKADLAQLLKTQGITNEVVDLLKEGSKKISDIETKKPTSSLQQPKPR